MKPFDYHLDHDARLLRITLRGFWHPSTVAAYERTLTPIFAELAARRPEHTLCLVDGSSFPIQGKEVTDGMAAFMARIADIHPDRIAIVVGNVLQKMQVTRNACDSVQLFDEEAEAMDWLRASVPARAVEQPVQAAA